MYTFKKYSRDIAIVIFFLVHRISYRSKEMLLCTVLNLTFRKATLLFVAHFGSLSLIDIFRCHHSFFYILIANIFHTRYSILTCSLSIILSLIISRMNRLMNNLNISGWKYSSSTPAFAYPPTVRLLLMDCD